MPQSNIIFGDGNLGTLPDLGDSVVLLIGAASGGPFNKPRRASDLSSVLAFLNGPLVADASHHVEFSEACVIQRCRASQPGTFGSISKTPVGSSPGVLAASVSKFSVHAEFVSNGAAMNVISGWVLPPSPLPLLITSGVGTVAHTQTVKYLNEEGLPKSEAISIAGSGQVSTVGFVKQVISVTSDVDPVGTQDYEVDYAGPQDRYDVVWTFEKGGQLSGGFSQPIGHWSCDGGKTQGRSQVVPSTGIVDLFSYGAGVPQASGVRLTFSSAAANATEFGSIRILGADVNGDTVWTALKTGVTIAVVVAGMGTVLSIGLVGDAITINSATDGGGLPITTGAQLVAFFNTDASPSTVAARQRARVRAAVGTGLSVLAAHAAAAFTNTPIVWTERQEGVTLRVTETGASSTRKVVVSQKAVDIYLDTDVNGVRTSTATQIAALVAGDAKASQLLSGVPGGSGAGLAGDTVGYLSLPAQFDSGDSFAFSTTPPTPTNADITEALIDLEAREDVMSQISIIRIIKDGADLVDFATFDGFLGQFGSKDKQFLAGIMSAAYNDGSTDEATWAQNVVAAYPNRGTLISIVAGEVDTVLPAYGSENKRNKAIVYTQRLMKCPLSELPSHVECDTIEGIEYSLKGVGAHLIPGGDPNNPQYTSLYETDDTLVTLHQQNFVTFRKWPKIAGVYVRQGVQYTIDGDDWQFITNRRIGNAAAALAYIETLRMVNKNMLVDPTTGQLAEGEHQRIEANVRSILAAKLLNDNGRQHVSAFEVISKRGIDFSRTFQVVVDVNLVGRTPAITFTTTINVVRTLVNKASQAAVG